MLEQWPAWVERVREALNTLAAPAPPWLGPLAFWCHFQDAVRRFVSTTQSGKAASPQGW